MRRAAAIAWVVSTCIASSSVLAQVPDGSATSARLTFDSSAAECPDEVALRREVHARIGRDPFTADAAMELRASLGRSGRRFVARLAVGSGRPRQISSRRCEDVAHALALQIALVLDPERALESSAGPPPVMDADGDGILPPGDGCADIAEDADGWRDEDGCPDPDDDGDGISDVDDRCPREQETMNEYQDVDGCPDDPDPDADGVLADADVCPAQAEDRDGMADADGCLDRDDDLDEIPDTEDACPAVPEDRDGLADMDGCPESDESAVETNARVEDATDRPSLHLLGGLAGGSTPAATWRARIGFSVPVHELVRIEGAAWVDGPEVQRRQTGGLVEALSVLVSVGACLRGYGVFGCVEVAGGATYGRGAEVAIARDAVVPAVLAGVRIGGEARLLGPIGVRVEAGALVPFVVPTLLLDDDDVWTADVVQLGVQGGLFVELP